METVTLIECVRRHPCLYDTRDSCYKNDNLKCALWEEIGNEINETGEVARTKWNQLRYSYASLKKESKEGAGLASKRLEKWRWTAQLQFLDKLDIRQKGSCNRNSSKQYTDTQLDNNTSPSISPEPITSLLTAQSSRQDQISTLYDDSSKSHFKKKKMDSDDVDKLIDFLEVKQCAEFDAVDILFKSYARTFKSFTPQNQLALKLDIAKLFTEVERKEMQQRIAHN